MLPPYIIEQLRQREEARERDSIERRARLELPLPVRRPPTTEDDAPRDPRGVCIIQVG